MQGRPLLHVPAEAEVQAACPSPQEGALARRGLPSDPLEHTGSMGAEP